ncbi:hypothetical protein [Burkholderia pyrrocinia]|uniref:hypothetical protein n=1 Tax=Burkholderia pyrrocinia TaxID=60550 RepID=UPI0030D22B7D|nr:hypothetical protein [Burkholderia cepacia]
MKEEAMSGSDCPLEEGDRVDHKIFGFGTVSGSPTPMAGPDMHSPTGVRDAGWSIPVRWDDPARTAGAVRHTALRKLSSPDSRPFTYWDRQWQPLFQAWLTARRNVEGALSSFRPALSTGDVEDLLSVEREAFDAIQIFCEDERSGKHP